MIMKKILLSCWLLVAMNFCMSQGIGIGTSTPNTKAILEIKSTDKGVLFPRLTSAQRDSITNPPDGLHIYNTDETCLNYYDSLHTVWNCYCENDVCKVVVIKITANTDSINFYETYGKNYPHSRKFVIVVSNGVMIKGGLRPTPFVPIPRPSIDFSTMPSTATIKIINYGNILGLGGSGGNGATGDGLVHGSCFNVTQPAADGASGGNAVDTKPGIKVTIDNYGIVAGGAGGGGGGGRTAIGQYGGGGGGGASYGYPGKGGGYVTQTCSQFGCGPCAHFSIAQDGIAGQLNTGGNGGNGANGGGNGGVGGGWGQPGQNGTGTGAGLGGALGKAISGGSGNVVSNINGGISYGTVD